MIVLYLALFPRAQTEGRLSDGVVRTALSFLLIGSIVIVNFTRILWKISKETIPMQEWRDVKRVYGMSFIVVIASSLAAWLILPDALVQWNYPLVYFPYIVFNHAYARRVVRKDLQ
jgi:hypothetical protein